MGALDPHEHKRNQLRLPGPHGEVTRPASDSGQHMHSMDEFPMDLWPSFASSEDYYSTVTHENPSGAFCFNVFNYKSLKTSFYYFSGCN